MAKPKPIQSIDDLLPDDRNANRGTERGATLIRKSLKDYGAGRSVLADRDGRLIAGNKTVENARAAGFEKVRVVQTDGSEIVVVQRTDLSLDDRKARELALVDNRAGQVSLEWDVPEIEAIAADFGIELGEVGFADGDLEKQIGVTEYTPAEGTLVNDPQGEWEGMPEYEHADQTSQFRCIVHFANESDMQAFEKLVGQTIPQNTRSIWYPAQDRQVVKGSGYVSDES